MEIGSVSTFVASLVERALSKGNWKNNVGLDALIF